MKYPKINTIWKRDSTTQHRIMEGDYSRDEFKEIHKWDVTEKIDGTNIRINYTQGHLQIYGRTDNAEIPAHLYKALLELFTIDKMENAFGSIDDIDVTLFGEGYGPKIQKGGGLYREDAGFILFDVKINNWWLLRESVDDIADKLNIRSVPYIGYMDVESIVEYVKMNQQSIESDKIKLMEGVVCRTKNMLRFRNGSPIMWKLKTKDFMK